jgi:hypothetical protein
MVTSAAPAHGIGHPPPARPSTAKPSFERPLLGSLPWPRGAPGAGLSVSHPWQLLRTVILAMLAAANVLLLALRRQVGRSQNR